LEQCEKLSDENMPDIGYDSNRGRRFYLKRRKTVSWLTSLLRMTFRELTPQEQTLLIADWTNWLEDAIKELRNMKANLVANLSEEEEKGGEWSTCVDLLEELEELTTVRSWDFSLHSCTPPLMKKILKDLERLDILDDTIISNLQVIISLDIGWLPPGYQ
jgi:hypothetical protein